MQQNKQNNGLTRSWYLLSADRDTKFDLTLLWWVSGKDMLANSDLDRFWLATYQLSMAKNLKCFGFDLLGTSWHKITERSKNLGNYLAKWRLVFDDFFAGTFFGNYFSVTLRQLASRTSEVEAVSVRVKKKLSKKFGANESWKKQFWSGRKFGRKKIRWTKETLWTFFLAGRLFVVRSLVIWSI